jgi:peptidoglycan/LPS O-acetylase OafA/YrhL
MTADLRPETRRPKAPRLFILDGLRLLAATMVVFYHYIGVPNATIGHQGTTKAVAWGTSAANVFPAGLRGVAGYGWTGVELFFMISGFVICMSGWGRRPADFFVSRVVRLVPAYWAATAVTVLVLVVFPRLSQGVNPSVVLANLTMVQPAYGVQNLVPAYWTLFVELTFYLLFGIVAIGGITYRRMVTFCVLWSVASIAASSAHSALLQTMINPKYSSYFVAGIAFFLIYKFGGNLLLWAIIVYSWLISVNRPETNPTWQVTAVVSAFFIIMALAATHRLDKIRWRWLPFAGALTYPLYLLHQDIGFTMIAYLRNYVPAIALVILTYVAMLGLAWLVHRGVERPVAPLLRAKLTDAVNRVRTSGPRAAPTLTRTALARAATGRYETARSEAAGRDHPAWAASPRPGPPTAAAEADPPGFADAPGSGDGLSRQLASRPTQPSRRP